MVQTRTKFLTREQRRNLKSNSTQVKDPFTTRTKALSASQRQQLSQNRQEANRVIKEVDKQFLEGNFGTLKQAQDYYNKLPEFIKRRTSENPQKLLERKKQPYIDRINSLKRQVRKSSTKGLTGMKKVKKKARIKGKDAERRFLQDVLNRVNKGEFIDFGLAKSEARKVRKATEDSIKLGGFNKLSPEERGVKSASSLQVSQPTKLDLTIAQNSLNTLASGKELTKSQLERAKKLGVTQKEIDQARLFAIKKEEVQKGKKPTFRDLTNAGLSNAQANEVVKLFNEGKGAEAFKNLNTDKFFKFIRENPNVKVDNTAQVQAFKIAVNKEFESATSYKPLPFTSSVKTFEKQYNKLLAEREKLKKQIGNIDKVNKKINANFKSLQNKALTGQSMTPKEIEAYRKSFDPKTTNKENAQALARSLKEQLKALGSAGKTIVVSPVVYGRNLRIRFENGENNPLFNDIKEFAKGFKSTAIDPIVFLIKAGLKGGKVTVSSAYNYGKRITKEAQKGNFVIDDDLKKSAQYFNKLGKKITKKENLLAGAIFLGAVAIAAPTAITSAIKKGKKSLINAYQKNPARVLGQISGFLLQGTLISKTVGAVLTIKKLSPSFIALKKNRDLVALGLKNAIKNNKLLLKSGSITKKQFDKNIKIISKAQKEFKKINKLIKEDKLIQAQEFNPHVTVNNLIKDQGKTRTLFSVSRANIEELTKPIQKVEVAFKGAKVPEKLRGIFLNIPATTRRTIGAILGKNNTNEILKAVRLKRLPKNKFDAIGFKSIPGKDRAKFLEDFMFFDKSAALSYGGAYKGGNGTTTILRFAKIKINPFPKALQKQMRLASQGKLKQAQINKLRRELVKYVKDNPGKFTIGTRGASGAKASPVLVEREYVTAGFQIPERAKGVVAKNIEKGFAKGTEFYTKKNFRTRIADIFGFKVGNKFTYDSDARKFIQILDLYLNKPKTKSVFNSIKNTIKKYKWSEFKQRFNAQDLTQIRKIAKAIEIGKKPATNKKTLIKKLKDLLKKKPKKTSKKAVKKSKVKKDSKSTKKRTAVKTRKTSKRVPKTRKSVSRTRVPKTRVRKPVERVKTRKTPTRERTPTPRSPTPRSPTPRSPTPRSPTPRSPTPRSPTPRSPTPRIPQPTLLKPPITRIPNLSFDSKQLDNKILTFEGKFRERKFKSKPASKSNPIVTKTITIRDTKNRALEKVAKRVDNSLAASLTLSVKGIGKAKKDIKKPKVLTKFRTKKSKNTPVLQLVEKSKNRFDTKSEKREAKTLKKTKKKKKK